MSDTKEKLAFFDFCGTLVPFQSAPKYIEYVLTHYPRRSASIRRKCLFYANKFNLPHRIDRLTKGRIQEKEIELRQLKGYSEEILDTAAKHFYEEMIAPNLIPSVMALFRDYQSKGYRIVIVSGGYDIYLKYFAANNGVAAEDVISSRISIKGHHATGKLNGVDCMGTNKIKLLEDRFDRSQIDSVAVSDSPSDIPLLQWANKGIVVAPIPTWYIRYGFEGLLWK